MAVPGDALSFRFHPRPFTKVFGESAPGNFDSHTLLPRLRFPHSNRLQAAKAQMDSGHNGTARPGTVSALALCVARPPAGGF
jgi:hypothetical protein